MEWTQILLNGFLSQYTIIAQFHELYYPYYYLKNFLLLHSSINYLIFNFQTMTDSELLTVSLGTWMELPNLTMSEWKDVGTDYGKRITASLVAEYYQDYIKKMVREEYLAFAGKLYRSV